MGEDFIKKRPKQPKPPKEDRPDKHDDSEADVDEIEYSFNMGMWRIDTINNILIACAKKYRNAIKKKDQKSVHEYQDLVNTLFTETYIYMENKTGIKQKEVELDKGDVLRQKLDDYNEINNEDEALDKIQEIRDIYLSVRELLQKVGLDIPKKDKINKNELFDPA